MGNYKFRLANMMPNAWFYKLKNMSPKESTKNNNNNNNSMRKSQFSRTNAAPQPSAPKSCLQSPQTPRIQPNRVSYYHSSRAEAENLYSLSTMHHPKSSDTHFPVEPLRKSKKKSRRKAVRSPKLLTSSVSSGCSHRVWKATDFSSELIADSSSASPKSPCEYCFGNNLGSLSRLCTCKMNSSYTLVDIDAKKVFSDKESEDFDVFSEIELPPILTKSVKKEVFDDDDKKVDQVSWSSNSCDSVSSVKEKNKQNIQQMKKPSSQGLHRLRMRANSPRIVSRKAQAYGRRKNTALQQKLSVRNEPLKNGLAESFAVVKCSADPQRDFRDSMMEMIVENNIRKPKDLEELLACYLSLNSIEYHDVIVKVFEQIWFDLTNIKL